MVSESGWHCDEMLSKVISFIERCRFDVEILDYEIEIIHAF
ncbi:MAG: hypothetical protein SVP26_10600 [Chloroflexota bacterium]|nr:hypothetical protein [Chloroflexota bacterium]